MNRELPSPDVIRRFSATSRLDMVRRDLPSRETIAKFVKPKDESASRYIRRSTKAFNVSLWGVIKKSSQDYNRMYLRERAKRFRALGLTSKGQPRKHHWWMTATVEERKAHRREYLKIYMRKWRQKRKENHANSTDGI